MKYIPILIIISLLSSCKKDDQTFSHTYIPQKKVQKELILTFDTLTIEIPGSSYVGHFKMFDTTLFFLDKIHCSLFEFNLDGNFKTKILERGTGYNQIPKLQNMVKTKDYYILTHGWKFYLYDHAWNFKNQYIIDWGNSSTEHDLLTNPNPDEARMYEVDYVNNRLFVNESSGQIFFKIITEHPKFNAFISKEFYRSARLFASMDMESGKINRIFGNYSPVYMNYSFIPYHVYSSYCFANNKFYLSYPPDPKIYIFNAQFEPLISFGEEDIGISGIYEQTDYLSAFEDYELEQRANEEGIYTSIWALENSSYIFRKLRRDSGEHLLQVYDSTQLTGLISIPSEFEFIGDYNGVLYGCLGIDEENKNVKIIKVRI